MSDEYNAYRAQAHALLDEWLDRFGPQLAGDADPVQLADAPLRSRYSRPQTDLSPLLRFLSRVEIELQPGDTLELLPEPDTDD